MSREKIALALPLMGDYPKELISHTIKLANEISRYGELEVLNSFDLCPYDRARNILMQAALDTYCDYMVFLDADMRIWPGQFSSLFKVMREKHPAMVSSRYKRRGWPFTCVWSVEKEVNGKKEFFQVDAKEGVYKITTTGLGFAILDLNWIRKNLKPPFFAYGISLDTGEHITEDVFFCKKIREANGEVLGVAEVFAEHLWKRVYVKDEGNKEKRAEMLRMENDNKS